MKVTRVTRLIISSFLCIAFIAANGQGLKKENNFSQHKYPDLYNLKKIGNTAIFQGNKKKRKYFEGWYFKMVSEDESSILSVIPGISLSENGDKKHAFIQVIDGVTTQTSYFSFPIEEFSYSREGFAIKIGENFFSKDSVVLHLKNSETSIAGKIQHYNTIDYPSNKLSHPGIMGWYRFIPFMECYHGVVSLSHHLEGQLTLNGKVHDFKEGRGYIEKDWGSSMPSSWIWMQSNHFSDPNSSFMLAIADVSWLGKAFTGILGFYYHDNQIHQFATYRPKKIDLQIIDSTAVKIEIENRKNTFILDVQANTSGLLLAPINGSMERHISESNDAFIKITVLDKKGDIIGMDSTNIAGLELVGDIKKIEEALN